MEELIAVRGVEFLEAFLAEGTGRPRDEFSGFAPRVPVKPVPVADLANPADV